MQRHEGSEGREGEGEFPVVDSQGGADVAASTEHRANSKGKKPQQQRHRSDAKKPRKEEEGDPKKSILSVGKDSSALGEGDAGRVRRCKQQVHGGSGVRRSAPHASPQQQHQLPQGLSRRRQRRLPRPFTPPKEDVERGLRSLTR